MEVLPNGSEGNGAKRYTYNTAGYLTQVETHNGSGWDVQAEMAYNGLGQRLSMDAASVIAYYVMDGNRPLTATTGSDTTSYLYGLGVIGEESNAWSYGLTDGTNTQRQLTDATGEVTYSARYTPWGDTLESYGSGTFAFGYFGGLMDAATGLLYVGDGQYYDPSTGRFLTRGARPNSPNPYLPFDPTGALFLPLALVSLVYGRKRRKSKWDILVIIILLSLSAGMGVAACNSNPPPGNITATGTATPVPGGNIVTGTLDINGATVTGTAYVPTSSPYAPIIATPCPTPTGTPTPIPTTDAEYKRIIEERFGIIVSDDTGKWATAHIQIVYSALSNIDVAVGGMLKTLLGTSKKFLRDWESATYSGTTYKHQINFHFNNKLPYHLIYHEMGHLLDNAQGDKYTRALDQIIVYTGYPNQTGDRVMGRNCPTNQYGAACKTPPYDRIDGKGYIQYHLIKDPSGYNVETEMHPRSFSADGNTANEEWGDLFANYVAGNFNLIDPIGLAKYNWVRNQLFGG